MAFWLPVQCPHCHTTEVIKNGKSAEGKQHYRCHNLDCPHRTFTLNPAYPGRTRQVKQQIVEMTLNGSGVRDIARVLHVSTMTAESHEIGKRKTQRIEQKHLRLRTRIKRLTRKTICFSKSEEMHDLAIDLFINRCEFGFLA